MDKSRIVYTIDRADIVTDISGDWRQFADANDAEDLSVDTVLDHSIYDAISGQRVKYVYNLLFTRARDGNMDLTFPFRCDSPTMQRFLRMTISPLSQSSLQLVSEVVGEKSREPVMLLDKQAEHSGGYLSVCSWCKKVKLAADEWKDIEDALEQKKLFNSEPFPQLSHGICTECDAKMSILGASQESTNVPQQADIV